MPTPSSLDVAKFIQRLEAMTSTANVNSITLAEHQFVAQAKRFHGTLTVSNAFRSFFISTIDNLNELWGPHISSSSWPLGWHEIHTWVLPRLAHNFKWLCGAEQQAFAGYPYPAFAQVRNIFDSAVITSGVLQKFASYRDAEGITPGAAVDPDSTRKKRISAERAIFNRMTGRSSGLDAAIASELQKIDQMFDWETHGQRLTATESIDWFNRKGPLHFLPRFDESSFAPFMNRYLETMWLVHRLLPFVRPPNGPLPEDWRDNWTILDESLETCAFSLTAQFDKPIGRAIVEFVKAKFPFDATSTIVP